ncbi:helix-turn-helix domain-containing protein [Streptomyces sp. RKAG290]|uniref:TetR/AcrR family transcriptional regulator n=1 Tax=Streptomyces sp. RKAG290 TaxID=2888348 RepID=UPI00203373AF|nr:helix-turn-helix domain-containing protein [Streptomyces sp. RKAG290]MCM2416320.1 TetR/AcrR family transcriptional regulator [Streptomyces sp. RKAG290]
MVGMQRDGAVRGPGRPREERVAGAVLEAVVGLVTEQGIGAVTMDAVAARAGVSKPAIYRRWPTKQDLIIAAAETRIGALSVPDLGDFRAELRFVLTARLEAYRLPGSDRLIAGLIGASADAGAGGASTPSTPSGSRARRGASSNGVSPAVTWALTPTSGPRRLWWQHH